ANAAESMLPPNPMIPGANALQNTFQPPSLGQAGAPVIQPFTLQPPQSPTPMFPGLIAPQLTVQVQQGLPTPGGSTSLRNVPNPGVSQPPTPPPVVLPGQTALAGQVPPAQGAALSLPAPAVSPPPPLPPRVEIINGQAANSSLEQLGCGFDWLTNTCKDVFNIGWCGQCHDFGNIFVHDCKCVRPLIVLPPRQPPRSPQMLFSMI
ncbi:hypothetical protein TELCIR_14652, partial [Teladorsagia circumcincta]